MSRITIDGDGECKIGNVEVDELVLNMSGGTCTLTGDIVVKGTTTIVDGTNQTVNGSNLNTGSIKQVSEDEFDRVVREETDKLRRRI